MLDAEIAIPERERPAARIVRPHKGIGEDLRAYTFLTPLLLLVIVFQLYVIASGLRMSLSDANRLLPGQFVGLRNFKDLLYADPFESRDFWRSAKITVEYAVACVLTQVPLAFLLACVLNQIRFTRTRAILRAAFLVPILINVVTVIFIFGLYFNENGLVNRALRMLGLPGDTRWLLTSSLAMPIMVLVSLWRSVGFQMIVFLGQLQTIDPALHEAARLEGASSLQIFRRITLPLLRPAVTFVMVTTSIAALQMFDLGFLLFPVRYGPGRTAETLVAHIYDLASDRFAIGLASAAGWLTFVLVLAVSLLQLRTLGLGRHDEA